MRIHNRGTGRTALAGFSMLEVLVALTILASLMLVVSTTINREGDALEELTARAHQEVQGNIILGQLRDLLTDAQGADARAWVTVAAGAGDTAALNIDTINGFPDEGTLLLQPGTANEERIAYESFSQAGGPRFLSLDRGASCGAGQAHAVGASVLWAGLGIAISNQSSPPASSFDGRSMERTGPVFFRGDGSGFSFRVPTDPAGGNDYFDGTDLRWGAEVGTQKLLTGRAATFFEASAQVTEAALALDINSDGDQLDVFDIGRLRLRAWDTRDGGVPPSEYSLAGSGVLQEQCNWGGDLDGDGFDDPIFLWDAERGRLRVRLFLLDELPGRRAVVDSVETVLFLQNPVEQ